jgi:putative PIG3 family NAD(P)H quinone oxidoreductase
MTISFMFATCIMNPGTHGRLEWAEMPMPTPRPGQVMVRIHCAAVNRADLLQRRGLYPPPAGESEIPGLECAGEIVGFEGAVGPWSEGDRVMALLAGGGYAEYAAIDHRLLLRVPDGMSYEEAAAVPEAFLTGYLNLVILGRVQAGESVLVHSGASGIGTASIQVAKHLQASVMTTVGSPTKASFCLRLGAAEAFNYRMDDWVRRLGENRIDAVLDTVGAAYLAANIRVLKPGGRLLLIGLLGGSHAEIDMGSVLAKNLIVRGSTLRNKSTEDKARLITSFTEDLLPEFSRGTVRPVVHAVFPISRVEEAHRCMARNKNMGKIVLSIRPSDAG